MKTTLVKHPKSRFGFQKNKMYHKGQLKEILSFAFGKWRLLIH